MTPQEINEFLGTRVMGWTLRRSKNPRYDWWQDSNGRYVMLLRQWTPSDHYFGLNNCFKIVEKLITESFTRFELKHVACVEGFTWAASIRGPANYQTGVFEFYGGGGKTQEEAICSMAVKTAETTP